MAIKIVRQAESSGARAHVAHGCLGGLLHDVTQLTGKGEPALAVHQARFSGQHLPADFGPGQSSGDSDFILLLSPELAELNDAEELVNVRRSNGDLYVATFLNHAPGDLA